MRIALTVLTSAMVLGCSQESEPRLLTVPDPPVPL
jgi:hypothetical protein